MQDKHYAKNNSSNLGTENLSLEERNRLVSAFAWLIKEDKKQNPALYQNKADKKAQTRAENNSFLYEAVHFDRLYCKEK